MTMTKSSINNFSVPKKLFNKIPHFLDKAWSKQQRVFAPIAMAMIFPGASVTCEASRILVAKDTEFEAVFSRTMKVIPYMHVARNRGRFNM
jgi:hypothetical protein